MTHRNRTLNPFASSAVEKRVPHLRVSTSLDTNGGIEETYL
jgi:hypothetical protein